ncbi:MAG TPA: tetratricopeptide repeat protein [Candidatus Binatia bacterium]|nr:tetratricopeptide repeat protein [Candidatus Binatia bacterium]
MMCRWISVFAVFAVVIFAARPPAFGQSEVAKMGRVGCPHCVNDGSPLARSLQRADELYASFKTKEALAELLNVLEKDPENAEALSKTARIYIDRGDMIPESTTDWEAKKLGEYQIAERYARRAVKADPNVTWGHFYVAASLGSIATVSPIAKQIDLAGEIRSAVEKSIALDPQNGFAYHLYGVWHRKLAEIGKMSRMLASVFYGRSIPQGDMEKSIEFLSKAVAMNPTVIASRLELARSYIAVENWPLARQYLKSVQGLPIRFSDDAKHKQKAEQLLQDIQ